jgi:1-phosphofructokinase
MAPRGVVFAPSLYLTVSVEEGASADDELHLHASGQGFWVAQLMQELGVDTTVVAPLGGEVGTVLGAIVTTAGLGLRAVAASATAGAVLEDRRPGERTELAAMSGAPLDRHDVDELYGATLVEALAADVCVLAGSGPAPLVGAEVYERLVSDLRANDTMVIGDLSGAALERALAGHVSVLKTSADDLCADGLLTADDRDATLAVTRQLAARGADVAVVTRAADGAIAARNGNGDGNHDGEAWIVQPPPLEPVEPRGSGDSLTAGLAAALAHGEPLERALRIGAAAGALNVTRRGLGSGSRQEIERLAEHVTVEPIGGN